MLIRESSAGTHATALRVDRANGIIFGVHVCGRESVNGRRYESQAMADGRQLCEGAAVNIDHNYAETDRSFRDAFGVLRNLAENAAGKNVGDLHFLKSHPLAEMVCEAAERFPQTFGLSHTANGDVRLVDGVEVVERITAIESVDIVRRPATNKGLFESMSATKKQITIRESLAKFPNDSRAAAACRLREMDEYGAATVAEPASADDAVTSAQKSLVDAVLSDPNLSAGEKAAKIKTILTAMEKMSTQQAKPEAATGSDAAMNESVSRLTAELARTQRQLAIREAADQHGVKLTDAQRKLLDSVPTDQVAALVESWKPTAAAAAKADDDGPAWRRNRPAFAPLAESVKVGASESYDAVLKEAKAR